MKYRISIPYGLVIERCLVGSVDVRGEPFKNRFVV